MTNTIFEKYGLGAVLSTSNGLDFDVIVEALYNRELPDGVLVWQPFEEWDLVDVAGLIEDSRDIFKAFADELAEEEGAV